MGSAGGGHPAHLRSLLTKTKIECQGREESQRERRGVLMEEDQTIPTPQPVIEGMGAHSGVGESRGWKSVQGGGQRGRR